MIYLLTRRESDGYDDNTTWVEGVYSNKEIAFKNKDSLTKDRESLIQQIEDANKRQEVFYAEWENSLRNNYKAKGFDDDKLEEKFDELELEVRNGVQDYLWDDYVNYKVIELKVDEDNGMIIL
jgi:hypothetical protein